MLVVDMRRKEPVELCLVDWTSCHVNLLDLGLLWSEKPDSCVALRAALACDGILAEHASELLRCCGQVDLLIPALLGLLEQRSEIRQQALELL